jgi:hypothetical protein
VFGQECRNNFLFIITAFRINNAVIIKGLTGKLTVLARFCFKKKEDRFIFSGYRKCAIGERKNVY